MNEQWAQIASPLVLEIFYAIAHHQAGGLRSARPKFFLIVMPALVFHRIVSELLGALVQNGKSKSLERN